MDPAAMRDFCAYLHRRHYAPHPIENDGRDLRLCCAPLAHDSGAVSWRDVDAVIQQQRQAHLAATTINRRLHAVKHLCASLGMERHTLALHPVKPTHCRRRGRPLPTHLAQEQVQALFAQITPPMDYALALLLLCCGWRVSAVARLRLAALDWEQPAIRMDQGKGRQDRRVSLSAAALAALRTCLTVRPAVVPDGLVFWHQKRPHRALSSQGIQKKIARYAKAAGVKASCHSRRHPLAPTLLEAGAEVIAIKALLGHASIGSSERDAKLSHQRVKEVSRQTIRKVIATPRVERHAMGGIVSARSSKRRGQGTA